MATNTITSLTGLIDPEAITVKFQAFSFFTITEYFFTTIDTVWLWD